MSKHTLKAATITMAHGAGGKAMRDLIDDVFVGTFYNEHLNGLEDQARFDLAALQQQGTKLAFTTDSYVVDPIEFPGGNIGTLAVNGTVNDLAVSGAMPKYLSCGMILEEGMAQRASDIDVVWINGYGWPLYTGGPMFWAQTVGLDKVVTGLERYGLPVSNYLRTKAENGGKFD